ncbi:GTPase IMAP family member 8-like isoform X1 [Silurus meridionalis]|uniref:GTPase IMAP family member 8-like isoform X1 n=1 Tax=Silurus meridionalis TaxID=175797 RepID=UPI001EEA81F1|nr:GTPase IMAP family member 8-like isoform X1 [Silurus meridionalis]XP_046695386.1 GTPase IMAP family member 8-like isoform X1 [Silurus meridionalis]XP_046695387.1 GTPase IMAP family member 8-like isoform X1 [Silurus meridionalis]XP_046695388.1 GTPase IMAP family member 8-like isoform X1 [Silurus meridionalis]XP_046695390.1 GTPase IMAP family member 8-like isoform X1 [Silurus meridionalis]XP_046695391.1 GTPase IMAP family member 8-like isoform X1 [Silurus meridionalis]
MAVTQPSYRSGIFSSKCVKHLLRFALNLCNRVKIARWIFIFGKTVKSKVAKSVLNRPQPELSILLVGSKKSGKTSAGITILGGDTLDIDGTAKWEKRQGTVAGKKITVVEAPGWHPDSPVEESAKVLKQAIVLSVPMCPAGPHAVLLVVRLDLIFTDIDQHILEGHLNLLGDKVWSHTIVLFTFGDSLGDRTIEQYINSEGKSLKQLVEKCGNRYHVFMNANRNLTQNTELLEKIKSMLKSNGGHRFEVDPRILRDVEASGRAEDQRSIQRRQKVWMRRADIRKRMHLTHHHPEVFMLLVGDRNAGKSSAGNIILNRDAFNMSRAVECVMREGNTANTKFTVVEAPGWRPDRHVDESTELLKQELIRGVSMCRPGPHAVLVVVRGDKTFAEKDRSILTGYMKLLGDKVWSHTIVLFTFGESLRDTTIERHIESEGEDLQWLVEKCGNRYHGFNLQKSDNVQVKELLEKIEEMIAENQGCHLEMDRKILQENEDRRTQELERSMERMMKVFKHKEDIKSQKYGQHHFQELRVVVLGFKNSGKSSTGNTIFGNSYSEFNIQHEKCVTIEGDVLSKKVTVVKAPGWLHEQPVEESTEALRIEIFRSLLLCPPGPHAVLLVVNVDRTFTSNDAEILTGYMNRLGDRIWRYTIVLFTFGDYLGDTTIERHIESEGVALQWLVDKCGNRYHVFNNLKANDNFQVTELFEKMEEMLLENHCCHFESKRIMLEVAEERMGVESRSRILQQLSQGKECKQTYTKLVQEWRSRTEEEKVQLKCLKEESISFQKHVDTEVTTLTSDEIGAAFVDQHREALIQNVSSVMELVDRLQSKKMITKEMYNSINVVKISQEQMRVLYTHLDSGGRKVKGAFYEILKDKMQYLVQELESGSV